MELTHSASTQRAAFDEFIGALEDGSKRLHEVASALQHARFSDEDLNGLPVEMCINVAQLFRRTIAEAVGKADALLRSRSIAHWRRAIKD